MAVRGRVVGAPATQFPQILPEVVDARGTLADSAFLTDDDVAAVAVAVAPPLEPSDGVQPRSGTVDAAARYGIDLAELADRSGGPGFTGEAGDVVTIDLPRSHVGAGPAFPWADLPHRLILLGIGSGRPTDLRRAGAALARATRGLGRVVSAASADADTDGVVAFVEGYLLAAYRPPRVGGDDAKDLPAEQLVLLGPDAEASLRTASRAARATWLVRDLANTPSNLKNPEWFADRAAELAASGGLTVSVKGPRELKAEGFGALTAVGAASASPPRFVVVSHEPGPDTPGDGRHVVVVGKGITYDTGGLSIKPREAMVPMKTDMAGAAVALATVLAAAESDVPHRVTAVLPLAENHVGASSLRPGDILRTYSGRTVEVLNTDAEGRLVLADALAFAARQLGPDLLVDVATLTGAASLGLGRGHGALYTADDDVAAAIEGAATATGERVWRMPLVEDYRGAVRSEIADVRNTGGELDGQDVRGGSITAALFLQEFTEGIGWVHLDIAGPARATSAAHEVTEGATGYGARLLLRFLEDWRG